MISNLINREAPLNDEELRSRPTEVRVPDSGVIVFESRHAPGFPRATLCDPFSKFLFVIEGKARVRAGNLQCKLSSDSLLHVSAKVTHQYEEERTLPVTLLALCFRPEVIPQSVGKHLCSDP